MRKNDGGQNRSQSRFVRLHTGIRRFELGRRRGRSESLRRSGMGEDDVEFDRGAHRWVTLYTAFGNNLHGESRRSLVE